jgi:hypothetical protein
MLMVKKTLIVMAAASSIYNESSNSSMWHFDEFETNLFTFNSPIGMWYFDSL